MIIIAGTVDVDPDRLDAALEAGRPHVEGGRSQKGCIAYVWAKDPMTPGRIQVYECWAGEEDLAAHFSGEHYVNMRNTIAQHGLRGADVTKYRVEQSAPVYDNKGQPRADFSGS